MARDVDNVVNTSSDPVVAIVVATSAVTSELQSQREQLDT